MFLPLLVLSDMYANIQFFFRPTMVSTGKTSPCCSFINGGAINAPATSLVQRKLKLADSGANPSWVVQTLAK